MVIQKRHRTSHRTTNEPKLLEPQLPLVREPEPVLVEEEPRARVFIDMPKDYPDRPHGHESWAHMWSRPEHVDELHALAERIGLLRSWFQGQHPRMPHYDVTGRKFGRAVEEGARVTDLKQWIKDNALPDLSLEQPQRGGTGT